MARFSVITFGCQMNQHDSERVTEVLRRAGHAVAREMGEAELIVVNTCSVRAKAEQKLRSELGRLARTKRQRPGLMLCVAGCVAQQEGRRLVTAVPEVDLVIGPDNIGELPALVAEVAGGSPPLVRTGFDVDEPRFLTAEPRPGEAAATAFVTVMKGCNERCSFCVVPHTRGPERYRPAAEIIDEISRLVAAGVREVALLGQTVNSYHDPAGTLPQAPGWGEHPWQHTGAAVARRDESEFAALLRAIAEQVPELWRLRYTSPHPRFLTWSLIRAHQDLPALAQHVHLPVQSGSDAVLKRMVRRHTVAEYEERVERLRAVAPGVTLSTDIIVGFPGETAADFQATLELLKRIQCVGLFGFKYSERPHTPAAKLVDDVDEEEKSDRLAAVFEVSDGVRDRHLRQLVGTVQQVLVEGRGADGRLTGRTGRNEIVHFESLVDRSREIVPVRIVEPFKHSLLGELDAAAVGGGRALRVV